MGLLTTAATAAILMIRISGDATMPTMGVSDHGPKKLKGNSKFFGRKPSVPQRRK